MASITREITIHARPELLWDALRDVGALHTRLVPGFVTGVVLEEGGAARVVTFGNGLVARERIVGIDDERRRLAWAVSGSTTLTHHSASAQVFAEGDGASRFVWIADLLPDEAAPAVTTMIEHGLDAMKRSFETNPGP